MVRVGLLLLVDLAGEVLASGKRTEATEPCESREGQQKECDRGGKTHILLHRFRDGRVTRVILEVSVEARLASAGDFAREAGNGNERGKGQLAPAITRRKRTHHCPFQYTEDMYEYFG
jgi:hypothetical protein